MNFEEFKRKAKDLKNKAIIESEKLFSKVKAKIDENETLKNGYEKGKNVAEKIGEKFKDTSDNFSGKKIDEKLDRYLSIYGEILLGIQEELKIIKKDIIELQKLKNEVKNG